MSHTWSHNVRHNVTDAGRDAGRTTGVTLLQTRPDQTRVLVAFRFPLVESSFKFNSATREGVELDGSH